MSSTARNSLLVIIALAAAGFAAYRFTSSSSAGRVELPDEFAADVVCLRCTESTVLTYPSEALQPYVCPSCGQAAAYNWLLCQECDRRFVPELEAREPGGPLRPVPFPKCPACRCQNYTGYNSSDPDQHVKGDAKLPTLPNGG